MKKPRKALLTSALSLLLCFTMLLGTTFAWFTDSVTNSNNIIKSGNLDIELEYAKVVDGKIENWKTVKDDVKVFDQNALWEPGRVEVVYLKVSNLGTLALKYQLGVNVVSETPGITVDKDGKDTEFKLSDHLVFKVVEMPDSLTTYTDREAVETAAGTEKGLKDYNGDTKALDAKDGTNDEDYVALIVYMPTTVGNEANYKTGTTPPEINLGLKLVATQKDAEMDSFGSDYDVDAEYPEIKFVGGSATAEVKVEDGKVAEEVTLSGGQVGATVPAGATLEPGTTELTLNVTVMEQTGSDITTGKDESMVSVDVHVAGLAEGNTVPVIVTMQGAVTTGLNKGNLDLYHVEKSGTNKMSQKDTVGEVKAHNDFYYDPATGDLTVAMATFSEIATVSNMVNAWNGVYDTSWYNTTDTSFTIANADQLAGFGSIVGGMATGIEQDSFSGKTVKLISDINIGDLDSENGFVFYPVGYWNSEGTYEKTGTAISSGFYSFQGTFDGNGHTVANFYQNTWEMKGDHNWYDATEQRYRDGMGLFGKVYGGTVKNLTVENFSSDGEITTTGVIAAYADCGATFENIAIFNCNPRVYNIGNGGIVGCVGWYANDAHTTPVTFRNITVDNTNKISALWGSWDVACGGLVGQYYPTSGQESAIDNGGIYMENCHVAAQIDVNNDVCANYQYYAYRYAGMMIGSIRENVEQNGHVYPDMSGISAKGCTVHFGTWNDYYYCELVANTLASYTHDHQMSRLVQVKAVNGTTITYLDGTTGTVPTSGRYNYVVVNGTHATENATCYHFVNGDVWNHADAGTETVDGATVLKEDKQHLYLEFNNLFTGYGWGVTSKGITDYAEDQIKILDREEGNSVKKFESVAGLIYKSGSTVKVGDLFKYIENCGIPLDADNVQVTVSPVTQKGTAGCRYTINTTDWTQGTVTFSGLGDAYITITDYHFCKETTITVNVYDQFNSISAKTRDNYYDVGHEFTVDDFAVTAIATSGLATVIPEGYTVNTSGIDTNAPGTYTATITYVNTSDENKTFTETCEVKIADLTERDDYTVTLLGKPLHIYIGADRLDEYPSAGTHTTANGEMISGLDSSNYQDFDFTVDNALRSTRLAFNAPFVTNNAAVRGFGYYIDGNVGSLVTTDSFVDGNNGGFNSGYTYGGHVDTSHMIPMYCNNFAAGTTHTVHWVVLFDEGIKTVGTWAVNMKEGVVNDEAFVDTDKPNANVIILAGQSNAFGITPLTQAVKNQYANVDFSNVFIRYSNMYYADGTGANANLKAWYSNLAFEEYEVGKGVYDDGSRSCFGPELGIAAQLVKDHPGEQWYIIKYTMPSSTLATNWMGSGFTVDGKNTNMMNDMLDFIAESVDMLDDTWDVNIKGFAWMQGESDATTGEWANAYAANEQMLIETVRTKFAAYATRTTNASDVSGSGIAFLNAGIASYDYVNGQVVPSQWTYENTVNTAKVNNSEYIFSAFKGHGATDLLGSGVAFPQATHLEAYTIGGNLWIQKPESGLIANSMFIDTVGFHTKATITKDHTDSAYTEEDKADHAHYAPDYMTYLGSWCINCMDLLQQQNG